MLALVLALVASLLWGVSDFLGGVAARGAGVLRGTAWSYVAASAVLVAAALGLPGRWSGGALSTGLVAGIATMVGFLTFYAAIAAGAMGVVSAGVALGESALPVLVAVGLHGDRLSALAWLGVGTAICGGLLLGLPDRRAVAPPSGRVAVLTLVSGVAFGVALIALDAAPADSGLLPVAIESTAGLAVLAVLVLAGRRWARVAALTGNLDAAGRPTADPPRARTSALASGVVLGLANALLIVALRRGELAVVAVVIALYPVGTVVLARVVLGERLRLHQLAGIGVALAACALLAVG